MITHLHKRIVLWKLMTLISFMVTCVLGCAYLMQTQHLRQYQVTQIAMLEALKTRDGNIANLCEAVHNQEYLIRRELPLVRMSWKEIKSINCQ